MTLIPAIEMFRQSIEEALRTYIESSEAPRPLVEAMAYALLSGGKRLRATLVLATTRLFEQPVLDPLPAACAVEMIHAYSLIHDDLPALDNDDWRRGRPSCHRQFGEALALLAGDALQTDAFGLVARAYQTGPHEPALQILAEIGQAAGAAGMVGGQVLDILATGKTITQTELQHLHALKTGALIRAAVRCGARAGGAAPDELADLTDYATATGLAFQVVDDILDCVSTSAELGKTAGKDSAQGKSTFVSLLGIEASRAYAERLRADARCALERFSDRATDLRQLADFIVDRRS